jgi:hypothetical protein
MAKHQILAFFFLLIQLVYFFGTCVIISSYESCVRRFFAKREIPAAILIIALLGCWSTLERYCYYLIDEYFLNWRSYYNEPKWILFYLKHWVPIGIGGILFSAIQLFSTMVLRTALGSRGIGIFVFVFMSVMYVFLPTGGANFFTNYDSVSFLWETARLAMFVFIRLTLLAAKDGSKEIAYEGERMEKASDREEDKPRSLILKASNVYQDLSKSIYHAIVVLLGQYSLLFLINSYVPDEWSYENIFSRKGTVNETYFGVAIMVQVLFVILKDPVKNIAETAKFWGQLLACRDNRRIQETALILLRFFMDALINVIVLVYTIGILPLQASLEGSGMDFVLIVIAVFYILQIHDLKVPKGFSWPQSTSLLSETGRVTAKRKLEGKFQEMINAIIKMALVSKKRNRAFFACTFIKEEFNQFHRVLLQETMTTLSEAGQDYKKLEKQNASDEAITAKLDEIELIERLISALNESHGNLSEKLASFEDHVSINLRRSDSAEEDFDDHESIIRQSDSAEEFERGLRQLNSAEEFERGLRQLCWCSRGQNIHYCDACHSLPPDQIAFGARHV